MNLELAHDLLAKQIFQRLSAEEKAMRKAERLLRDGYELDHDLQQEDKRRLLSREDISFIQPYLNSLQIPDTFKAYFVESDQILREAEEAEKKALKKRLERQRYLIIAGGITGIIIIVLLFFSIRGNFRLNEQIFENELARAMQFRHAEQYESEKAIYDSLSWIYPDGEHFDRLDRLKGENYQISRDAKKHKEAMDNIEIAREREDFLQAIKAARKAEEIDYKSSEAKKQIEILTSESKIAFNRYKKRGLALYDVGEISEACEWLNKAFNLNPDDPQVNQKRETCQ